MKTPLALSDLESYGCHMLATKIRGWKTHWLWVIFTHVWNCHTALLNLSGLNAGFPAFREQSNEGQFYLGVYWPGLFVCQNQLYRVKPLQKAVFVISDFSNITVNVTKSIKAEWWRCWPRCYNWFVWHSEQITSGTNKHMLVFIMLCRSVYCVFHLISRQAVKYWYCSLKTTDFTAECCFMQCQSRPCSWRWMLLHCAELIIPVTSVKEQPPHTHTHTKLNSGFEQ